MERLIRRLLLLWLALLAGVLLSQRFPFPDSARLGFGLLVAVGIGSPVVAGLLLRLAGLRLRALWHRARVLRRAARWRRRGTPPTWKGLADWEQPD